jgi:ParB-like chromosome segregation protein Spo0J
MIEVIHTIQIPVSQLVPNNGQIDGIPKNPRFIRNERFEKLVKSIQDNPEFLGARELIVHKQGDKYIVLCGNMRFRASKELNIEQLPCKVIPEYFSLEQIKAIIIKDNISFGSDDMDALANEWDVTDLVDWGMEFNNFVNEAEQEPDFDDLIGEEKNKPATMKITFESPEQLQKAEIDIQELLDRKYKGAYFSVSAGEL